MLSDSATRWIRTIVPIAVGTFAAWAVKHLGVYAPDTTGWADALTGALIGGYYSLVAWAEVRWPQLGWLLGAPKTTKP